MNQLKFWLLITLLVKLALALVIPLAFDEYYYFLWGQHLSLSYFDHPPLIGWLLAFSGKLSQYSPGFLRLPTLLLGHGTLIIWLSLFASEVNESKKQRLYLWVAVLNPLWGLGNFIATPDIPLLFFWSLALLFTKRILDAGRSLDYFGLGLALGFGFLSKYQIVLFVPSLLLLVSLQKRWDLVLRPQTLITLLTGFLTCLPVLIWNHRHDWISFGFQARHGFSSQAWKWYHPLDYLAVQALLLLPPFVWLLYHHRRRLVRHWLFPFMSFPFLFFFISSLRAKVEANWVIMAFPAAYMLSVLLASGKELKWVQHSIFVWAGATTLLVGVIVWQPNLLARTRLYEAESLRQAAKTLSKPLDVPLYAFNYQSSSVLSFYLDTLVCKRPGLSRRDHFDYMPACQKEISEFYLLVEKHVDTREISSLESHQVLERQSLTGKFDLVRLRQ